eukprot:1534125-Pleurochrysis_carterae.AAC.6
MLRRAQQVAARAGAPEAPDDGDAGGDHEAAQHERREDAPLEHALRVTLGDAAAGDGVPRGDGVGNRNSVGHHQWQWQRQKHAAAQWACSLWWESMNPSGLTSPNMKESIDSNIRNSSLRAQTQKAQQSMNVLFPLVSQQEKTHRS